MEKASFSFWTALVFLSGRALRAPRAPQNKRPVPDIYFANRSKEVVPLNMATFTIPHSVGWRERSRSVLVANIAEGECYELWGIEAFIWRKLASGVDEEALLADICNEYDVEGEIARAELAVFVGQLKKSRLLQ